MIGLINIFIYCTFILNETKWRNERLMKMEDGNRFNLTHRQWFHKTVTVYTISDIWHLWGTPYRKWYIYIFYVSSDFFFFLVTSKKDPIILSNKKCHTKCGMKYGSCKTCGEGNSCCRKGSMGCSNEMLAVAIEDSRCIGWKTGTYYSFFDVIFYPPLHVYSIFVHKIIF